MPLDMEWLEWHRSVHSDRGWDLGWERMRSKGGKPPVVAEENVRYTE